MSFNKKIQAPVSVCRLAFLFGIILFFAYSNSFQSSWQLDDKPQILKNESLHIESLSTEQLYQATHGRIGSKTLYRPVATLSFALNWYFGKDQVLGYHIVNFLIHFSVAWLLFLTIKLLFTTPRYQGRYSAGEIYFIAVFSALFWALNPIQIQAVTYIVQRMASLAALFSLFSLFLYLKARLSSQALYRAFFFLCSAISYLLAIFSKENAAAIILALPVFEILFFHHTISKELVKKIGLSFVLAIFITILGAFSLRPELFDFIFYYYHNRPFTLSERFLSEQRILIFYLSQLFYPAPYRFSVDYNFVVSTSIINPLTTLLSICANLFLIILACKAWRKFSLLSLAILFFYINHLVESTIIPLELIFDHRNYLPSLFLFVPFFQFIIYLFRRQTGSLLVNWLITGTLIVLLILTGLATYVRNQAWKTEETLWLDALSKAPTSSRPYANLALQLAFGKKKGTERNYRKALELTERSLTLTMSRKRLDAAQLGNMASIYSLLGEYDKSLEYFEKSLALAPQDILARYNRIKVLIMIGDFQLALNETSKILEEGFIHPDYYTTLGHLYLWTDQPEKALPVLRQAMRLAPGKQEILLNIGKSMSLLGHYQQADWFLRQSRTSGGNSALVSLSIIENLVRAYNPEKAADELEFALKRFPVPYLLSPLKAPADEKFRSTPLSADLLSPFLQEELPKLISEFSL